MKIIDLTEENEKLYFLCLEDWSSEMEKSGDHKECWYNRIKDKVRVKLALDDKGNVGGMIQYIPIEESFAQGQDLYLVLCVWVHGYKEGRGNFQKKGMGKTLLKAAEDDVRQSGAKGLAVWGVSIPFWMKASWFKKQGYMKVDKNGMMVLMWKPFTEDAVQPTWIRQRKAPEGVPGKVTVTAFINGWCPASNLVYERAKAASAEFGDKVDFVTIDTSDRDVFLEWGISDALFFDREEVSTGPPPPFEKLKKAIGKKVKKLK